jgi:hypothetical protein
MFVAALVLSMGYINLHAMPPPDDKEKNYVWHCIQPVGSCSYLTFWSLSIITQYTLWSCLAELAVAGHFDDIVQLIPFLDDIFSSHGEAASRRILAACYYLSPFAQGWAITLTILWLKFNWSVNSSV